MYSMTTKSTTTNGETAVTAVTDLDNQKSTSTAVSTNSQEQHPNPAAAAAAEARATFAKLSQAPLGVDDDDDIKKRRRRSSLLRRSLSSNFVLGGSGSGRRPSNNSIAAAARDDLKKKSRSLRDLSELDSEDTDDDDEDGEKESTDQKLEASSLRSHRFERKNRPDSTHRQPVRGSRQPILQKQYQTKPNQDDEESHNIRQRRPVVQRSGSFTSRTSETIHTVVNPLDVILQLHRIRDNYFYKLCPHHTGNNRVGVMVDLQLSSFIKLQIDNLTKETAENNNNKDGNKSNRICEEIVRTVEEHWQGRFLLQVEEQGVIGYTLLTKIEASQAVYDIFQETIDAAAKEASKNKSTIEEIIDLTDNNEVVSSKTTGTTTTKATTVNTVLQPKKSVLKTTVRSTTGNEDNISVTSSIISNIEPISLKPSNAALTGSGKSTASSSIFPVYGEQTDVHKSALASLQRRKRRQYATTKISNLVTGRGLIPLKKTDDMSISSSISGGDGVKRDDRSVTSFSSLPTEFNRENATRSYSEAIEYHPGNNDNDQFGRNLNRYERGELHINPGPMYPPMGPLGKNNNRSVSDSEVLHQNRVRENLNYQIMNHQGSIYANKTTDMRRASSSTVTIGGAILFSILDEAHEEDFEPFPAEQQPHEISESLQEFQEMFSQMPSPYNPNNNLNNNNYHQNQNATMPAVRSSPYEMTTSNGYNYDDVNYGNNNNYGQNASDGNAYDPSSFAQQDYVQQQDISAHSHVNAYGINQTIDELNPIDEPNPIDDNLYHEEQDAFREMSSVRFQDPAGTSNNDNMRRASAMDFANRRSTRLSNFSQNMIQDLLFQLSSSGQINFEESDED